MGDFNQIAEDHEKKGGGPLRHNMMRQLQDIVDVCALVDLGFDGPCFTWSNMRIGVHNIQGRLDRGYGNHLWLEQFVEASISHLPRPRSDHHPILLHNPNRTRKRQQS